eukprot:3738525-Pyramimonas_sp.AAC.1
MTSRGTAACPLFCDVFFVVLQVSSPQDSTDVQVMNSNVGASSSTATRPFFRTATAAGYLSKIPSVRQMRETGGGATVAVATVSTDQ